MRSLLVLLPLALAVACNSGNFAGTGQKQAGSADLTKKPEGDAGGPDQKDGGDDDGKPVGKEGGGNGGAGADGDGQPSTDGGPSLGDVVGDVNESDGGTTSQPTDDSIIFGDGKLFHIGDGQMSGSSCLGEVNAFDVAGEKYFFEFEVTEDDTDVTIELGKICGVDYPDTNRWNLRSATAVLVSQPLTPGQKNVSFPKQTLKKGKYFLEVQSDAGTFTPGTLPEDHDDYLVGQITLHATAKINPGTVGAQ